MYFQFLQQLPSKFTKSVYGFFMLANILNFVKFMLLLKGYLSILVVIYIACGIKNYSKNPVIWFTAEFTEQWTQVLKYEAVIITHNFYGNSNLCWFIQGLKEIVHGHGRYAEELRQHPSWTVAFD